jgi:hypothetical protein
MGTYFLFSDAASSTSVDTSSLQTASARSERMNAAI